MLDNSFDNLQAAMEQKLLMKYAADKENVILMDIICFEYILLEFKDLIAWIYAPDDEFLVKRKKAITAREKLVKTGDTDYKDIREIIEYNENVGLNPVANGKKECRMIFAVLMRADYHLKRK